MLMTSSLLILFVLIALACPYADRVTIAEGVPYLHILIDNSNSFALFYQTIPTKLASDLFKGIRTETKSVGNREQSAIGDAVLTNLQQNGNILLISDGNNNFGADLGDVALYAAKLNTSISAIRLTPAHKDARAWVSGPTKTLEDGDNKFTIHLGRVGEIGAVKVQVDR